MSENKDDKQLVWIKCSRADCPGVVATASLERGYVHILRSPKQQDSKTSVIITGRDFDILANCHNRFCSETTRISVENGKLNTKGLRIKKNEIIIQKEDDSKS